MDFRSKQSVLPGPQRIEPQSTNEGTWHCRFLSMGLLTRGEYGTKEQAFCFSMQASCFILKRNSIALAWLYVVKGEGLGGFGCQQGIYACFGALCLQIQGRKQQAVLFWSSALLISMFLKTLFFSRCAFTNKHRHFISEFLCTTLFLTATLCS